MVREPEPGPELGALGSLRKMAERLQSVADGATQKGREKVESCRDMVGGSFNKLGHTAATVSAVGASPCSAVL